MSVRSVGQYPRRCYSYLAFLSFELLWEYPEAIPKVVPDGKESGADELSQIRGQTQALQPGDYEVIHYKIYQSYYGVAAGDLSVVSLQLLIIEYPEALQRIIDRPAHHVGAQLGPPQVKVQTFIADEKYQVAAPEIGAAAYQVFDELDD